MFAMFATFFRMLEKLCAASYNGAVALENISKVGVVMSEGYAEDSISENAIKRVHRKKELAAAKAAA